MRNLLPFLAFFPALAWAAPQPNIVELQTNAGTITVLVDPAKAPVSAKNFVAYAQSGFYKNTLIHRVIKGFVVQGGGFDKASGQLKPTLPAIKNEASNRLSNLTGTIAMARTDQPDTATSQFFINLADNKFLDYLANPKNPAGYAVFGKVVRGMDIVAKIGNLSTAGELPFLRQYEMVAIDNVYASSNLDNSVAITRITVNGNGKVTSAPLGIDCGKLCSKSLPVGKPITLTATADPGYYFAGWRGDCQGVAAKLTIANKFGNHNCMALFAKAVK